MSSDKTSSSSSGGNGGCNNPRPGGTPFSNLPQPRGKTKNSIIMGALGMFNNLASQLGCRLGRSQEYLEKQSSNLIYIFVSCDYYVVLCARNEIEFVCHCLL
uniref:Uncharacterized protein n=1 Tax=Chenopodium quinoa TaxID=63459 RepID=A0A803KN96_CHEQI